MPRRIVGLELSSSLDQCVPVKPRILTELPLTCIPPSSLPCPLILKTIPSSVILFKYITGLAFIAPTMYDPANIAKPSLLPVFDATGLTGLVPSVANSVPK